MVRRRCLAVPVEVRRIARLSRVAGTERTNRLISIFIWIFDRQPPDEPALETEPHSGKLRAAGSALLYRRFWQLLPTVRPSASTLAGRHMPETDGNGTPLEVGIPVPDAWSIRPRRRSRADSHRTRPPQGSYPLRQPAGQAARASKPNLANFAVYLMLWLAPG